MPRQKPIILTSPHYVEENAILALEPLAARIRALGVNAIVIPFPREHSNVEAVKRFADPRFAARQRRSPFFLHSETREWHAWTRRLLSKGAVFEIHGSPSELIEQSPLRSRLDVLRLKGVPLITFERIGLLDLRRSRASYPQYESEIGSRVCVELPAVTKPHPAEDAEKIKAGLHVLWEKGFVDDGIMFSLHTYTDWRCSGEATQKAGWLSPKVLDAVARKIIELHSRKELFKPTASQRV